MHTEIPRRTDSRDTWDRRLMESLGQTRGRADWVLYGSDHWRQWTDDGHSWAQESSPCRKVRFDFEPGASPKEIAAAIQQAREKLMKEYAKAKAKKDSVTW